MLYRNLSITFILQQSFTSNHLENIFRCVSIKKNDKTWKQKFNHCQSYSVASDEVTFIWMQERFLMFLMKREVNEWGKED